MSMITFLFFATLVHAGEKPYCVPLPQVDQRVLYCFQNEFFVQASDLCLHRFEEDVQTTSARLANGFARNDAASVSAQNSKLHNTGIDLANTDSGLTSLVKTALKARAELVAYGGAMIYPGDPSPAFVERYGLKGDLEASPCFRENYLSLADRIARLDRKIAELRTADGKTLALAATTADRLAKLQAGPAETAPRLVKGTLGQGSAAPALKGRSARSVSRNPASTITGDLRDYKLP